MTTKSYGRSPQAQHTRALLGGSVLWYSYTWYDVRALWYIRCTNSLGGIKIWMLIILIHAWYVIPAPRYQVWYAIRTPQWVRTQSNIPADEFMLQVSLARSGATDWKLWYQREILAWTSPVQLEGISRASSTNLTLFWTRAEVGGAAK